MRTPITLLAAVCLAGTLSAADARAGSCGSNFLATMIACPACGEAAAEATKQCYDDQQSRRREAQCAKMSSWTPEYHELRIAQVRHELNHGRGQRSDLWHSKYTEYIELAEKCRPAKLQKAALRN